MHAVNYYRNVLFHRTSMLEGVRLVAFRNVSHLRRTSRRLAVDDADDADAYRALLNGMITDQGMDANDETRWMFLTYAGLAAISTSRARAFARRI